MFREHQFDINFELNKKVGLNLMGVAVIEPDSCGEWDVIELKKLVIQRYKKDKSLSSEKDCLELYKNVWNWDLTDRIDAAILEDYKIYRQWHEEETRERRKKIGKYLRR